MSIKVSFDEISDNGNPPDWGGMEELRPIGLSPEKLRAMADFRFLLEENIEDSDYDAVSLMLPELEENGIDSTSLRILLKAHVQRQKDDPKAYNATLKLRDAFLEIQVAHAIVNIDAIIENLCEEMPRAVQNILSESAGPHKAEVDESFFLRQQARQDRKYRRKFQDEMARNVYLPTILLLTTMIGVSGYTYDTRPGVQQAIDSAVLSSVDAIVQTLSEIEMQDIRSAFDALPQMVFDMD